MSEAMKGKYEVLRLLRANVLLGIGKFTQSGWQCIEANQQSFKNFDKVILLTHLKNTRVGWQSKGDYRYEAETQKFLQQESWIEQQEWEIKALLKRNTDPVTDETVTTEDIISMLISWFNSPRGVAEFRKNGCANLFVSMKDMKLYNDNSDVSQYQSSFVLKLQVPKTFVFVDDSATVVFKDAIGV